MPSWVELCKVEDVPIGEVRRVAVANLAVAVYNLDGDFYVTDDACTHGPGQMSEGFVDGDVIECNFHRAGSTSRPARSSGRRAWCRSGRTRWSSTTGACSSMSNRSSFDQLRTGENRSW
jgi:Rieske 2Fe-2S protein